MNKGKEKRRPDGSYTVEAAFLLPLILTVLAMFIGMGARIAGGVAAEMGQIQVIWESREPTALPMRVRAGQAIADWFGGSE